MRQILTSTAGKDDCARRNWTSPGREARGAAGHPRRALPLRPEFLPRGPRASPGTSGLLPSVFSVTPFPELPSPALSTHVSPSRLLALEQRLLNLGNDGSRTAPSSLRGGPATGKGRAAAPVPAAPRRPPRLCAHCAPVPAAPRCPLRPPCHGARRASAPTAPLRPAARAARLTDHEKPTRLPWKGILVTCTLLSQVA